MEGGGDCCILFTGVAMVRCVNKMIITRLARQQSQGWADCVGRVDIEHYRTHPEGQNLKSKGIVALTLLGEDS